MTTAIQIVTDALKELGVLAENDTPSSTQADDALRALNRICDLLSNQQAFAYTPSLSQLALTGQSSFTIGQTGDLIAARPIDIETAFITRGTLDYPCRIVDNQLWDSIIYKGAAGANPTTVWYEPTFPNGTVHVWPIATGCTINLRTINQVTNFATLSTVLSMPPGYEECLIKNLAVNISPQYPAGVLSPITVQAAKTSLKTIQRTNNVIPTLSIDPALNGRHRGSNLAAFMGGY